MRDGVTARVRQRAAVSTRDFFYAAISGPIALGQTILDIADEARD
jgi:hypothetical protein